MERFLERSHGEIFLSFCGNLTCKISRTDLAHDLADCCGRFADGSNHEKIILYVLGLALFQT
eukprot:6264837-Amphidinium_carterae.1